MAFTASALSFMLENLGKTVCITGSQITLCRPRNDGIMNLLGAVSISGQFDIPEVVLYFGSKLIRGCRSSKLDANGLSTFDSQFTTVGNSWRKYQYKLGTGSSPQQKNTARERSLLQRYNTCYVYILGRSTH